MDREGFRNRLKQYKQAREENPGLKYWEWKGIPKYDEGTDNVLDQPLGDIQIKPFKGFYSIFNNAANWLANKKKDEIFGDLPLKEIRNRLYKNMVPWSYADVEERLIETVKNNKPDPLYEHGIRADERDDIFAEYLEIPQQLRKNSTYKVVQSNYKPTKNAGQDEYKTISNLIKVSGEKLIDDLHKKHISETLASGEHNSGNLTTKINEFEYLPINKNKIVNTFGNLFGPHTIGRGVDPQKGEYVSFYDNWDLAPFGGGKDESNGIGNPVKFYDRLYLDDFYDVSSKPKDGDYYGGYLPEVEVKSKKYKDGGEVRDNTYVAPIEKEQVFIPATGATKFLQEYRKRTPKAGNLEIVSPEFDLLTGIRAAAMLPTKAEKLGRILDNSDFITDDKITDLINSKYISDLTTFTKKNKNDANWYVHTDLGKSSSVFAGKGKGAYIHDKKLHPGEALIFDQKPYVWWNQGKRYTNLGENKDGYQAIVIKNNNAKDLLQVKSSQSPIGQWDGKQGFVLPSEYVTHDAVNLTPDIQHYVYDALTKTYGNVKHYAEGTDDVTGPPTYEQWYADMTKYNPTILDNASLQWSIDAAKKDLHSMAMELSGYAPMWNNYMRSLPKNDPDINEFVDDLWENENPNNVGYKKGKYYPHKSPEGGAATIGPGFKLGSGSHNISTREANKGVTKARLNQEARRIGKQHLNAVDQFLNYGQTANPADTVSPQIKMGLMDLRHQVGPLNEWSNLRQAVLEGDLDRIKKESTVTWNDNGKTKVDKRRKKIRDEKYFYYE